MKIDKDNYIRELKSKNIESLNFIIDTYSNLLFKVAYSVLDSREYSEECINDVFMKIWNNADRFDKEDEKFRNWICTITKYTAIDMLRKVKKHDNNFSIDDEIISENNSIEKQIEDKNDLVIIRDGINSMDKKDREIFIRKFYYGEKVNQIAKSFGMTENAVNLRILRGRKKLSEKIGEEDINYEK